MPYINYDSQILRTISKNAEIDNDIFILIKGFIKNKRKSKLQNIYRTIVTIGNKFDFDVVIDAFGRLEDYGIVIGNYINLWCKISNVVDNKIELEGIPLTQKEIDETYKIAEDKDVANYLLGKLQTQLTIRHELVKKYQINYKILTKERDRLITKIFKNDKKRKIRRRKNRLYKRKIYHSNMKQAIDNLQCLLDNPILSKKLNKIITLDK
ncbi:MAG: hypothetical protein QXI16_00245 [Sulfolobaceae archaeon]